MSIRFGYAINQWKPQFDDFVRREQHERALKTISIAGFEGVELSTGTGRWEPLGNPQQLAANFGSVDGFREFLDECAVSSVSSWFWNSQERSSEFLTGPLSPMEEADRPVMVERAAWYAEALARLGGSVLVVRPTPDAGDVPPLDDDAVARLAGCWEAVARATADHGIRTALHVDFLSALRRGDALDRLLDRTDADLVGLAVDTGELAVAGIDPVTVIKSHAERVWHVHLKDALAVDTAEEYLEPHAHWTVRVQGGVREVPRWFAEPGHEDGLVDSASVLQALVDSGYDGWVVVESDQSPHPATSALLAGYLVQRELAPIAGGSDPSAAAKPTHTASGRH
ncbi:sugar phosphate isomerase/epimerase [Marmoricola sp. URHB0036]|uniref:sugar phosphate isomerase/epimerase family protein n=1 Tax=Marmoricola sp. URHB0036 TaxID=1298863 RepID=UPI000417D1C9|nr:sugar phosphate isomerase/epimerase [Marmoricola sp. URHB0036]